MHVFMRLSIAFPSLMTAFAMFAMMERAGRKKGGKGLLGWFKKLPWKDARFLALFLAMATFIPAGAGGIAQTNFQLNQVVHKIGRASCRERVQICFGTRIEIMKAEIQTTKR